MKLEDYQRACKEMEQERTIASKAQGGIDQMLQNLEEQFQCHTPTEAEKLLVKLTRELERARAKLAERERQVGEEHRSHMEKFR